MIQVNNIFELISKGTEMKRLDILFDDSIWVLHGIWMEVPIVEVDLNDTDLRSHFLNLLNEMDNHT